MRVTNPIGDSTESQNKLMFQRTDLVSGLFRAKSPSRSGQHSTIAWRLVASSAVRSALDTIRADVDALENMQIVALSSA
jgi:hypothetical protein